MGVTVPFRNSIGVAESRDNGKTYTKPFQGPIIDRNKNEPYFVASSCVLFDEGIYKIWYLSCTEWFKSNDISIHKYHIKYAESVDGIDWDRKGTVAVDYADIYLSGPAAKNYLDESIFTSSNIKIEWMDYNNYPEYRQLSSPFEHRVTILDLIFNEGDNATKFMKSFN